MEERGATYTQLPQWRYAQNMALELGSRVQHEETHEIRHLDITMVQNEVIRVSSLYDAPRNMSVPDY